MAPSSPATHHPSPLTVTASFPSGTPSPHPDDERFIPDILASLTSDSHLQRDRALAHLQTIVPILSSSQRNTLQLRLLSHLTTDSPWHTLHACTLAFSHLLPSPSTLHNVTFSSQTSQLLPLHQVHSTLSTTLIPHAEPRVRTAATTLIARLAAVTPRHSIASLTPTLLRRLDETFTIAAHDRLAEAARIAQRDLDVQAADAKQRHNLVHETEGWRGLETTLLALAALMGGVANASKAMSIPVGVKVREDGDVDDVETLVNGHDYSEVVEGNTNGDDISVPLHEILDCVSRARTHTNRFVREAALKLLDACAHTYANPSLTNVAAEADHANSSDSLGVIATKGLPSLREGLQDNWSQVRYAASVATRTILSHTPPARRNTLYDALLPAMCLNRHYVAEGVRAYSQQTWQSVLGADGRPQLVRRLNSVLDFYDGQTRADNHAVREASCQALGEAVVRLEASVVRGVAGRVAASLVECFKDESWPVRDHACRALASVLRVFPREVEAVGNGEVLKEIRVLFVRHLSDNIPSVREHCAEAFVTACLAFDDGHAVMGVRGAAKVAREEMAGIEEQRETNGDDADVKTRVHDTQFGASTQLAGRGNVGAEGTGGKCMGSDDAHTNQVMYSCGSLAPKLRRGGGCSDHGFVRPREGWEQCEGGLLVWRALLRSGERGRRAAEGEEGEEKGLLWVTVENGMKGVAKRFRQRGRFLEAVLGAVTEALSLGVRLGDEEEKDEVVLGVMRLVKHSGDDESEAVRRAGRECRRVLCGRVGLRAVADAERSL